MTIEYVNPVGVPTDRPAFVGLTGGIGSGKSTVASVWRDLGVEVVDADALGRKLIGPGGEAVSAVAREFGSGVLVDHDEALGVDRGALGELVFRDHSAKTRLEAITHPLIEAKAWERLRSVASDQIGVYDVPLLVENSMAALFDVVVVVTAPIESRLEWLERRGVSRIQAQLRIEAQAHDEERFQVADIVIANLGSQSDLEEDARQVLHRLRGR